MSPHKISQKVYEFGDVEIYPNYLICTMKEGITVKPEYNDVLVKLSQTYFRDTPFGYITFRKNSYAVDPRIYLETSKIKNLVAFAVITPNTRVINTIDFEKNFLTKPLRQFSTLDKAIEWVNELTQQ